MKPLTTALAGFAGGVLGAIVILGFLYLNGSISFGAVTARTTITNPWTFSATTTMSKPLILTHTNSATSTFSAGCIQTYATSTASPIAIVLGNGSGAGSSATTTFGSIPMMGLAGWGFGYCPNLP